MSDSERLREEAVRKTASAKARDKVKEVRRLQLVRTVADMAARQGVDMSKFNDPEHADRLLAQKEREIRATRIARQVDILLSRLPADYQNAQLPNEPFAHDALRWLATFRQAREQGTRAPSLAIMGPVGTGKTYVAAALARILLTDDMVPVTFITAQQLIDAVKPAQGGLDVDMLQFETTPLLVLDDFGNERLTEWAADQLHRLAHSRSHNGRPMIITTNFEGAEIKARYSQRLVERLFGGAHLVTMPGESRRQLPF